MRYNESIKLLLGSQDAFDVPISLVLTLTVCDHACVMFRLGFLSNMLAVIPFSNKSTVKEILMYHSPYLIVS